MAPARRILAMRFSSIGDIVLATSPLETIRRAFPDGHITFLTLDAFMPLLEYHPHIDALIPLRKTSSIRYHWQVGEYLNKNNYDLVFDLHNSLRSWLVGLPLDQGILRLEKPRWKRWQLFQLHHNEFPEGFDTRLMYHQHLGEIWREGDPLPETTLVVTDQEKNNARRRAEHAGITHDYAVMVPGAAWGRKQWSPKKYAQLSEALKETRQLDTILLGSKKDRICFEIEKEVPAALNLAGETDLRQALAILANAWRVVGSDTGLVHAAEALDVPVSMILGPTSTETGAGTILPNSRNIATADLWCRPCSQNGKRPCYRSSQVCMESITVDQVYHTFAVG